MATGGKKEIGSSLLNIGTLTLKSDDLDPSGIVVVGDKLVITDWRSSKVHVYRRHDGMLLSSSDRLESRPYGVCCVNDTDLCVVMNDGIITLMSVSDSGLISRGTTFHLTPSFGYCTGVASFRDNVVVSGVKDDTIYWCVVSIQDGRHDNLHKVCGGTLSRMTTKENMAYLSCSDTNSPESPDVGVYGFNLLNPSQPPYIYKGLSWPRGITVDDDGYLFVCDFNSIHHLTEKCELVAIFKEGIPRHPFAIFWDRGILYLTAYNSNVISMYETPHQGPAISAKAKTKVDREDQKEKRQLVIGRRRAIELPEVSQKGKISRGKQEAKISPLKPMIKVDPVERVTQTLSETSIDQPLLIRLSKDLVCPDWKFFFRELSVSEADIEQVGVAYGRDTVREQIYQLLYRLKQRGKLNMTNVIAALRMVDREDLVAKYSEEEFS